jgi:hypothetical protein
LKAGGLAQVLEHLSSKHKASKSKAPVSKKKKKAQVFKFVFL